MRRDEVIERLKQHEADIRALGAASLYLYGSHARDEAREDSDVDLFVDKDPRRKFGFMEYTGLIIMLEDIFGRNVDVSTRNSLHPMLKDEIEATAIRVF
jgi:predicted nucleotidyltransferase